MLKNDKICDTLTFFETWEIWNHTNWHMAHSTEGKSLVFLETRKMTLVWGPGQSRKNPKISPRPNINPLGVFQQRTSFGGGGWRLACWCSNQNISLIQSGTCVSLWEPKSHLCFFMQQESVWFGPIVHFFHLFFSQPMGRTLCWASWSTRFWKICIIQKDASEHMMLQSRKFKGGAFTVLWHYQVL